MKPFQSLLLAVTTGLYAGLSSASAHFNITGTRTLDGNAAMADIQPLDGVSVFNNARTLSGSFGWADATDSNWGDSHRLTPFLFTLASTQTVSITIARNDLGTAGSTRSLLPAFSLFTSAAYMGEGHDTSTASVNYLTTTFGNTAVGEAFTNTNGGAGWETGDPFVDANGNSQWDSGEQYTDLNGSGIWEPGDAFTDVNGNGVFDGAGTGRSGKEGVFRSLAPWKIFTDGGTEVFFNTIIGHAADGTPANYGNAQGIVGDGNADGTVNATFANLAAGDYFLVVGGANYGAVITDTLAGGTTFKTYGIDVTVSAVPEPTSAALLGAGALAFAFCRRPRRHTA